MAGTVALIPRGPRGRPGTQGNPGGVGPAGPKGNPGEFTEIVGTHDEVATMTLPAGRTTFRTTGRSVVGDGGAGLYVKSAGEPAVGSRFKTQDAAGNWWEMVDRHASVLVAGAQIDGATDDHAATQQSVDRLFGKFGGGDLLIPPTTKPLRLTQQVAVPNTVSVSGLGHWVYPGPTAPKPDWTRYGSWVAPENMSDSAFKLYGGAELRNIAWWYDQPTPGPGFSPIDYPFTVEVVGISVRLRELFGVGVSRGVHWNYTQASGGGTMCSADEIYLNCLRTLMRFDYVNDCISFSRIRGRGLWHSSTPELIAWLEANYVPFDTGYLDNADFNVVEFFECSRAFKFRNQTIQGNTHSAFNCTFRAVSFNLVRKAMEMENSETEVWATFTDTTAQTATEEATTDTLFDLRSNKVDIKFNGLLVNDAGGKVMEVGAGSGGEVAIDDLEVRGWSGTASGQTAITAYDGSTVRLPGRKKFKHRDGSGNAYGGAGRFITGIAPWNIYRDLDTSMGAGTGDWVSLLGGYQGRPVDLDAQMATLSGSVEIKIPSSGGTVQLRIEGLTEIITLSLSAGTIGFRSFNTGVVQLTSLTNNIGRLQFKASAGVVIGRVEAALSFL